MSPDSITTRAASRPANRAKATINSFMMWFYLEKRWSLQCGTECAPPLPLPRRRWGASSLVWPVSQARLFSARAIGKWRWIISVVPRLASGAVVHLFVCCWTGGRGILCGTATLSIAALHLLWNIWRPRRLRRQTVAFLCCSMFLHPWNTWTLTHFDLISFRFHVFVLSVQRFIWCFVANDRISRPTTHERLIFMKWDFDFGKEHLSLGKWQCFRTYSCSPTILETFFKNALFTFSNLVYFRTLIYFHRFPCKKGRWSRKSQPLII